MGNQYMKLVLATKNINKIREISEKFSSIPKLQLLSLSNFKNPPLVIEDGTTFEKNATKKARIISAFTELSVLADDSGLEIDALDGEPGVFSARYAGENANDKERNMLILKRMKYIPREKRGAKFICVISIVLKDGREYLVKGECNGIIYHKMLGNYGFGYDPIFYLPGYQKTMAELPLSKKNQISHRAIALEKAEKILYKLIHS